MEPQPSLPTYLSAGIEATKRRAPLTRSDQHDNKVFTVTIGRSCQEIYTFWRNDRSIPFLMPDSEIIEDEPAKMIAWKSDQSSKLKFSATVWFDSAEKDMGTVVKLAINGDSPSDEVQKHLKQLKAFLETNEIPTTEGQPNGKEAKEIPISSESESIFKSSSVKFGHKILN